MTSQYIIYTPNTHIHDKSIHMNIIIISKLGREYTLQFCVTFIPDTTTSKGMFYILTASFINQSGGGLRLERYICLYTE